MAAFLAGLKNSRDVDEAAALLRLLRARGNQLRPPHSKKIEAVDNLFELRGHQVRIFYMFRPGRVIVLLDGEVKKRDKIPRDALRRVLRYKTDVDRHGLRGSGKERSR